MSTSEPWTVSDTLPDVKSRPVTTAALNADIGTLTATKGTLEIVPVNVMFESVIGILCFVRDEMIDDDAFVELTRSCVRAWHVLKTATEGRGVDSLNGSTKEGIESLERIIHSIESNLKANECVPGASCSCERHSRSAGACPVLLEMEIQRVLEVFELLQDEQETDDVLVASEDEQRVGLSGNAESSTPVFTDTRSSGCSSLVPAGPFPVLDSGEQALQCLISGAIPQDELSSYIEAIFSSEKATDDVGGLEGSDAQTFVDFADKALETADFSPGIRRKCLRSLYKTCAGKLLLPSSLQIKLPGIPTGDALYRGGFGDVWKCEYEGRQVAVKVLRRYGNSDPKRVTRMFCKEFITWKALCHPNVLPLLGVMMSETRFAMVSEWMPNGNISQFVKAHRDANRFELLGDVAKGLIYMHEHGMVHGDLKGANILIDETRRARLADFGLLAIVSDTSSFGSSSPSTHGGTVRWMSPELFCPENFGLKDRHRTKRSDCYALGMVIYEVLSGQVPFPRYDFFAVVVKVSAGERPERPQGAEGNWFIDNVWKMLERCWTPKQDDRPSIGDVFRCLEEASGLSHRMEASLPTTNSPAQNLSDSSAEGNAESEVSFPSHAAPLEALQYEVAENQDLEAYVNDPSESGSERSAAILGRALSASDLPRGTSLRRRIPDSRREGPPFRGAAARGRLQRVRPPGMISQIVSEWMKHDLLNSKFFFLA